MKSSFSGYLNKIIKSFGYALRGIWLVVKTQRNFRIHLFAAIVVILAGFLFNLSHNEWAILILTIFVVFSAEAFNTAIEKVIDLISPGYNKLAGEAKDIAAGAVLLTAIMAIIIGMIIFLPKIIEKLS